MRECQVEEIQVWTEEIQVWTEEIKLEEIEKCEWAEIRKVCTEDKIEEIEVLMLTAKNYENMKKKIQEHKKYKARQLLNLYRQKCPNVECLCVHKCLTGSKQKTFVVRLYLSDLSINTFIR